MNPNMMTQSVLLLLQKAQESALKSHHQQLTPYHILESILQNRGDYVISKCLEGVNFGKLNQLCNEQLAKQPEVFGSQNNLTLSNDLAQIFMKMEETATKRGDKFISLDSLILCLFSNEPVKSLFIKSDGNVENLQKIIGDLRMNNKVESENAESEYDALNRYAKDVTKLASEGKLDPVIGRDEEIRRTLQVLSRRTKNNPILIGEPGVGKTAIVEGLALRIIKQDVPDSIK